MAAFSWNEILRLTGYKFTFRCSESSLAADLGCLHQSGQHLSDPTFPGFGTATAEGTNRRRDIIFSDSPTFLSRLVRSVARDYSAETVIVY
jgi:hypothetical protein